MAMLAVMGWLTFAVSESAKRVSEAIKVMPLHKPSKPSKNLVVKIMPIIHSQTRIAES